MWNRPFRKLGMPIVMCISSLLERVVWGVTIFGCSYQLLSHWTLMPNDISTQIKCSLSLDFDNVSKYRSFISMRKKCQLVMVFAKTVDDIRTAGTREHAMNFIEIFDDRFKLSTVSSGPGKYACLVRTQLKMKIRRSGRTLKITCTHLRSTTSRGCIVNSRYNLLMRKRYLCMRQLIALWAGLELLRHLFAPPVHHGYNRRPPAWRSPISLVPSLYCPS